MYHWWSPVLGSFIIFFLILICNLFSIYSIASKIEQFEPGNIRVSVYQSHLVELGIEIEYGDYIGYYETETLVRYYTVNNDGRVVSDNKHTYAGYKPFYRTIIASPVGPNEFRGLWKW